MKTVKVQLKHTSYPIFIGAGIEEKLAEALRLYAAPEQQVIITDGQIEKLYLSPFVEMLKKAGFNPHPIVIKPGERSKSVDTYLNVISRLLELQASRDWGILALGGGVVGDLAGFVAATYMRGLPFYQIPTTLLAQVDASIGGKVAINHPKAKNIIGAFYQPRLVWIDVRYLKSLPQTEILCGLAEIVKHGIIKEETLFSFCETELEQILTLNDNITEELIYQSCRIKASIVEQDEKESGMRALLNYGHTVGHALEAAARYRGIKHGEAVWWGMLAEAYLAAQIGLLPAPAFERMKRFFVRIPLKSTIEGINLDEVRKFMMYDKKKLKGTLRFALPIRIGEAQIIDQVPETHIQEALSFIQHFRWVS